MVCTWNPSDVGSSITLSDGNLKWVSTNAGSVCGRATLGYLANSGRKLYHEQTVNVQGSSAQGCEIGVANGGELLTNFLGASGHSVCVEASTGDVFIAGSVGATFTALIAPANTVIGQYTDFVNSKFWWTVDGITFYGGSGTQNPSTNTGGFTLANTVFSGGGSTTVYPAFGSRQSGPAGTANFSGPFAHAVASGFSAWAPGTGGSFFFAA
jgi:hypothetical protein